jgi:signal transduction histidine kinase
LTIALRIRVVVVAVSFATAAGLFLVGLWGYGHLAETIRRENLRRYTETEARRLEFAFEELRHDARLLATVQGVLELETPENSGLHSTAKTALARLFKQMLAAKPTYLQVRVLSYSEGRELVRVDRTLQGIERVAEEDLQTKGQRDYVVQAKGRPIGEVFVSDITLNREHGQIEVPHRSMVRAVVVARDALNQPAAVVVINQSFDQLLESLYPPNPAGANAFGYFVLNHAGDFIAHPDPDMVFGFELGHPHRWTEQFASEDAAAMSSGTFVHPIAGTQYGLAYRARIDPLGAADERFLELMLAVSNDTFVQELGKLAWKVGAMGAVLLSLALVVGARLSTRLVRPIQQITIAAAGIAHGVEDTALPTRRGDEIGVLARSLHLMLRALRDKEASLAGANRQLQNANVRLKQFAHMASHDLREHATRIASFAELTVQQEDGRVSDVGRDWLTRIAVNARELLTRLGDYRVFSGLAEGTLERGPVDLSVLLRAAIAAHSSSCTLKLRAAGDVPVVRAYPHFVAVFLRGLLEPLQHCDGPIELTLDWQEQEEACLWTLHLPGYGPDDFASQTRETGLCAWVVARHGGCLGATASSSGVLLTFSLGPQRIS